MITFSEKLRFLQTISTYTDDEYGEYLGSLIQLYLDARSINTELTKILVKEIEEEYEYSSTHAKIIDKEVTKTYIKTVVEWDEY